MFTKLTITFVILLQYIEGYPSKSGHLPYNNVLSPRIVGGQEAPEGYAKHMVALVVGSHVKMLSCGASIINRRHILTAAHCIQSYVIWGELSPYLKGVIGSNFWNSTNIIKFSGYKIHPKYGWTNFANDIGLLYTAEKIVYSDHVRPIALKSDFVGGGIKSYVTGWGQLGVHEDIPYRLHLLYVKTLSQLQCVLGVKLAAFLMGWGSESVDPSLEICTIHFKGHGMCFGDSGSALVEAESGEQIGIVSWGFPCALGAPDMFVRVSAFQDFLKDALEEHIEH